MSDTPEAHPEMQRMKADGGRRLDLPHAFPPGAESALWPEVAGAAAQLDAWRDSELQRTVDRLVLARYGPPGLVINDRLEVIQFRGDTARFVDIAPGPANFQLLRILTASIASTVRNAVQHALEDDTPVRVGGVELRNGAEVEHLDIEVIPVANVARRPRCLAILFIRDAQSDAAGRPAQAIQHMQPARTEESQGLLDQLQQELISANEEKEQLRGRVLATAEALGRTQQQLRTLSSSLFTAQEEERRRVARELHDDISQRLALLGIDLHDLSHSVAQDSETPKIIDGLASRTADLAEDLRKISHGLHPSILDDLGLVCALKALGDEFSEREKMEVTMQRQNVPAFIPPNVAATLYRITQEALHNIAKHAGHTHVKITLQGTDEHLRLEVEDFGEGFDTDATSHGLGLISMSERAHLVLGTFSINSAFGKGTTVAVDVPIEAGATQ